MSRELQILIAAKQGDKDAKLELLKQSRKEIEITSIKYAPFYEKEDLKQEGCIGVLHAIRKFKFSAGVAFSTYSPFYINRFMHESVVEQSRLIRIPRPTLVDWREIKAAEDEFQRNGIVPTVDLVSDETGFTVEYISTVRAAMLLPASIEGFISNFSERNEDAEQGHSRVVNSLLQIVNEPYNLNGDANYREQAVNSAIINEASRPLYLAMEQLTLREFQVIDRLYGFNCEIKRPKEISDELGINQTRVSNLHKKAQERIAKLIGRQLDWFLDDEEN